MQNQLELKAKIKRCMKSARIKSCDKCPSTNEECIEYLKLKDVTEKELQQIKDEFTFEKIYDNLKKASRLAKKEHIEKPIEEPKMKHVKKRKDGKDKRKQPISQYDLELNWIADYVSIADASRKLGIDQKMIYAVVMHKRNHTHGFIFLRKGEEPKQFKRRNIYMRGEEMSNFIQKKEEQLESKINELTNLAKINGFNEVMNIIRDDEIALLKSLENKDKFVPLESAINENINKDVKAKVDYIEDLYVRLKEKCKQ